MDSPRDAYDELAESYAEDVRSNGYNAHIEFPGTSSLVPDVDGCRVLDAGCGTGVYSEWLVDQGADVVGIDVSEAMLDHARTQVEDAQFQQADLADPLEFPDDSFDGIVSALALGYVEEWRATFAEFARVLVSDGFLVFSVGHPFDQFPFESEDGDGTYFDVERQTKEWDVDVPYYRRPMGEIINPLLSAGFRLDRVLEPQPTEAFAEKRPDRYEKESRYPVFLCIRAAKT